MAAELNLHPSKRWGQNFVVEPTTVARITRLAEVGASDTVLEIGPGLGSLTLALLGTGAAVTAVEIDPRLAARLPDTVAEHSPTDAHRLRVVIADGVTSTADDLGVAPTRFVANLPYNVAVPIVLQVMKHFPTVQSGVVMVQAEVAARLAAGPGSRVYGAPSVKLAWYAAARQVGSVSPSVFWPVPRVESGLVAITRRDPPAADALRAMTFACVDAAFGQRRKGLRSALAPLMGSAAAAQTVLEACDIAPLTRGEQLAVADFARIAQEASRIPRRDESAGASVS